jgi:hypothetical protein
LTAGNRRSTTNGKSSKTLSKTVLMCSKSFPEADAGERKHQERFLDMTPVPHGSGSVMSAIYDQRTNSNATKADSATN